MESSKMPLGSVEAVERRKSIQLIVGAYAERNEIIIQMLQSAHVFTENVRPDELIDILLHEEIDPATFATIGAAARTYYESLDAKAQAQLLLRGSVV